MTMNTKPLIEINRQAFEALYRELGVVNAVRFLRQFTPGLGDYAAERDVLFGEKPLDEIVAEIRAGRSKRNADRQSDAP